MISEMMHRDTYSYGRVERDQDWVAGMASDYPSFRAEGADVEGSNLS
jgi:hypothetical protein